MDTETRDSRGADVTMSADEQQGNHDTAPENFPVPPVPLASEIEPVAEEVFTSGISSGDTYLPLPSKEKYLELARELSREGSTSAPAD